MILQKISQLILVLLTCLTIALCIPMVFAQPHGPPEDLTRVADGGGQIYVTTQDRYYDTLVPYAGGNLPYNGHNGGSFQQLYDHTTDYGPGVPGYRGGRWWIDNPDPEEGMGEAGVMDMWDTYFLCPLQGPGWK